MFYPDLIATFLGNVTPLRFLKRVIKRGGNLRECIRRTIARRAEKIARSAGRQPEWQASEELVERLAQRVLVEAMCAKCARIQWYLNALEPVDRAVAFYVIADYFARKALALVLELLEEADK